MRRFTVAVVAVTALGLAVASFAGAPSEKGTAPLLGPSAPDADITYVLIDARSGAVLESHWPGMNGPVPLGSLVKPFTALAYAQTHGYRYPSFSCKGESAGCWLPTGHGQIGIEAAISLSCNVYFRLLAERVDHSALAAVAWRFGVAAPGSDAPSTAYVGLGEQWQAAPLAMARAYLELVRREAEPGVAPLLAGMRQSAESGTGRGVGSRGTSAWAKTGTAPCVHQPASNGDGYAVAIYPSPQPRYVLLIQRHGVPGRLAAVAAGEMLAGLEGAAR